MTSQRTPTLPRVASIELARSVPLLEEGAHLTGLDASGDFTGVEAADLAVERSRLSASFTGARLPRLHLTDVIVEESEFSGADLEGCVLTRVVFRGCKMAGLLLPHARLRDVVFEDCRLEGANLRMARAQRIDFLRVDLAEGDLYAAEFEDCRFFDCGLAGAQISQAKLSGARLHGSRLDGLKGVEYLRDVVIDADQVLVLALPVLAALGIRVEGREPSAERR